MTYQKPIDTLPDTIEDEKVTCYKQLWEGLYCAQTEEYSRHFLCDAATQKRLSQAALSCAVMAEEYAVFDSDALGILMHELGNTPAFIDFSGEMRIACLYLSTICHAGYFKQTQLKIPDILVTQAARLYEWQYDAPKQSLFLVPQDN